MKKLLLTLAVIAPLAASAQNDLNKVDIQFVNFKAFTQVSDKKFDYLSGIHQITIRDGFYFYDPACNKYNFGRFFALPSTDPPTLCPLGTTGFVAQGDLNEDGVSDRGSFVSIVRIFKANTIPPNREREITVLASPSRKYNRKPVFFDKSTLIQYDLVGSGGGLIGGSTKLYEITGYAYRQQFPNLKTQDKALVNGVYKFALPAFNLPGRQNAFTFTKNPFITAYPGLGKQKSGFRITNGNWKNNGIYNAMELDPRVSNALEWSGVEGSSVIASDVIKFSIARANSNGVHVDRIRVQRFVPLPSGLPSTDPVLDAERKPIFDIFYPPIPYKPPSESDLESRNIDGTVFLGDDNLQPEAIIYPPVGREIALERFSKNIFIPGSFLEKGTNGIGVINFRRKLPAGGFAFDSGATQFRFPLRFVDSYAGHALTEFPRDADFESRKPNSDYDGDGLTNLQEFAFSTDDNDDSFLTREWTTYSNTAPTILPIGSAPPVGSAPVIPLSVSNGSTNLNLVTVKRVGVSGSVDYGYEVTYDNTVPNPTWERLKLPASGSSIVLKDKKAASLVLPASNGSFRWTIADTTTGTTISANLPVQTKVSIRASVSVAKGY
jgi:hypothetical protein